MQNETTKTLLEWNYNQYHDRYAHLYPEDNSGLNNYKIGQQNISHNYDKVDKTFKDKKLQSSIKKNILIQNNKKHSWMRKQVHGKAPLLSFILTVTRRPQLVQQLQGHLR